MTSSEIKEQLNLNVLHEKKNFNRVSIRKAMISRVNKKKRYDFAKKTHRWANLILEKDHLERWKQIWIGW